MTQLVSHKTANELIDSIYNTFHFNLMAISDSGIENSQERDYFWSEANKVDQGPDYCTQMMVYCILQLIIIRPYIKLELGNNL